MIFAPKEMAKLEQTEGLVSLDEYDLKPFYKPFASSANRVLIDYKKFRESLLKNIVSVKDDKVETKQNTIVSSPKSASKPATPISLKRGSDLIAEARASQVEATHNAKTSLPLKPKEIRVKSNLNRKSIKKLATKHGESAR